MSDPESCEIKSEDTEEQRDLMEEIKESEELSEAEEKHHIKTEGKSLSCSQTENYLEEQKSVKMEFIEDYCENRSDPEPFKVKHEDTDELRDLMEEHEEREELNEVEEKHVKTEEKSLSCSQTERAP
ncbi:unnamed protein product [Leuciscus chuanchicus]